MTTAERSAYMGRGRVAAVAVAAVVLIVALSGAVPAPAAKALSTTDTTIDGTRTGAAFQGVGAISGGGHSRLLIDYPKPQHGQILDYVFKPHYGGTVQLLKREIGGNSNSTDGADWFRHLSDVTPSGGTFSYTLQPGYPYTFTTNTGQSKGSALMRLTLHASEGGPP